MQTKILIFFLNMLYLSSFPSTLMATRSFDAQTKQRPVTLTFPLYTLFCPPTNTFGCLFKIFLEFGYFSPASPLPF